MDARSLIPRWSELPQSSAYQQRKLMGAGAPGQLRTARLESDGNSAAAVRDCLGTRRCTTDALGVLALHVLVQWYLREQESVIGRFPAPGAAGALYPSYIYAEDDGRVSQVIGDIEGQRGAEDPARMDWQDILSALGERAPAFHYEPGDGPRAGSADDAAAPFQSAFVCVSLRTDAEACTVVVRAAVPDDSPVSCADIERDYLRVLAAVVAHGDGTMGEIRRSLGERVVPELENMQREVIRLWSRILSVDADRLCGSSNYFDVGGTSLNAFKLLNRVRAELNRETTLRDIIENPTVREFSLVLLR